MHKRFLFIALAVLFASAMGLVTIASGAVQDGTYFVNPNSSSQTTTATGSSSSGTIANPGTTTGFSTGAKIGIGVGIAAAVAAFGTAAALVLTEKTNSKNKDDNNPNNPTTTTVKVNLSVSGLPPGAHVTITLIGQQTYAEEVVEGATAAATLDVVPGTYDIIIPNYDTTNFTYIPSFITPRTINSEPTSIDITYTPETKNTAVTFNVSGLPDKLDAEVNIALPNYGSKKASNNNPAVFNNVVSKSYTVTADSYVDGTDTYKAELNNPYIVSKDNHVFQILYKKEQSIDASVKINVTGLPANPDPNINKVKISLENSNNVIVGEHEFSGDGDVSFSSLVPGAYTLHATKIADGDGYFYTTNLQNSYEIKAGIENNINVSYNKSTDKGPLVKLDFPGLSNGASIHTVFQSPDIDGGYAKTLTYNGTLVDFGYLIPSNSYTIQADNYNDNGTIYLPELNTSYHIDLPTTISIPYKEQSSNHTVRGWPSDKISMGTIVQGGNEYNTLAQRPVYGLFTYAGNDGGGDRGKIILNDPKTITIMAATRNLESQVGKTLMPVFVFYTVDGSSGIDSMKMDLGLRDGWDGTPALTILTNHYINLINYCQLLETYKDAGHPVPATLILNPDFLGELHKQCGQYYCPAPLSSNIDVKDALQAAVVYLNQNGHPINVSIPGRFQKNTAYTNFADYIASINWLVRTIAPDVVFAWQDNVWAGDESGHLWLHKAKNNPQTITDHVANETAFLDLMGVYKDDESNPRPDFIVFDKWERDVFDSGLGGAGYNNGYLYNVNDWDAYLQYVSDISSNHLNNIPVMLWQIPGGHLQINGDIDSRKDHGSTAPDYFFGDSKLNFDLNNLESYISNAVFQYPERYDTTDPSVLDYLNDCSVQNCWQVGHMDQVKQSNVFAMLWGGGSTTGVVGLSSVLDDNGWLYQKIQEYYNK